MVKFIHQFSKKEKGRYNCDRIIVFSGTSAVTPAKTLQCDEKSKKKAVSHEEIWLPKLSLLYYLSINISVPKFSLGYLILQIIHRIYIYAAEFE